MQPEALPQEGDLLLFITLGDRAAKHFPKMAQAPIHINANSGGHGKSVWFSTPAVAGQSKGFHGIPGLIDREYSPSSLKGGFPETSGKTAPEADFAVADSRESPTFSPPGFIDRNWPWLLGAAGLGGLGYLGYRHFSKPDDQEPTKRSDAAFDATSSALRQFEQWAGSNPERAARLGLIAAGGLLAVPSAMAVRGGYSLAKAPHGYGLQSLARGSGIGAGAALGAMLGGMGHAVYGDPTDMATGLALRGAGALAGGIGMSRLLGPHPADKAKQEEISKQAGIVDDAKALGQQGLDVFNNKVVRPAADVFSEQVKGNFGLGGGGPSFFDRNPWAYAPVIGGVAGAGIGAIGSLTSKNKKKNTLGNALTGGLLGAAGGGLLAGAAHLWGDSKPTQAPTPENGPSKPGFGVQGGRDLTQPKDPSLLERGEQGLAAVGDSAKLTPQTNAAIEGPFQKTKDIYQTFRPGVHAPGDRSNYDDAAKRLFDAEARNDYQTALEASKQLHALNQSYGHMIANNLTNPGAGQLAGIGGLAATGVPAGKPLDYRLLGAPIVRGQAGPELGNDNAQLKSLMEFAKSQQPQIQSTGNALNNIDPQSMGTVRMGDSALTRSMAEHGFIGGAAGAGLHKSLNWLGFKNNPDARYWQSLERGMTSEPSGRRLWNPRGWPERLFGQRVEPSAVNNKAINQLIGASNQNRTGSWLTSDAARKALGDVNDPNRGKLLELVKGLGGRTGEGTMAVPNPSSFPLKEMASNPMAMQDLTKRLIPEPSQAIDAARAQQIAAALNKAKAGPTNSSITSVPIKTGPGIRPEDVLAAAGDKNHPLYAEVAAQMKKITPPNMNKDQVTRDLIDQLTGRKPIGQPLEKILLGADSPLGTMPKGTKIMPGASGPTILLQSPTRADTLLGAAKKTTGRVVRTTLPGGIIGASVPLVESLRSGKRITTTPLEQLLGTGPGGLDAKGREALKEELLRKLQESIPPNATPPMN